jgi:hypothetical protein
VIDPPPFTRARIAALCRQALLRAGALGVLPTPLEALYTAADVRERIALDALPGAPAALRDRILGAAWLDERALFVDERQSLPRRRFTEAHEIVHLLCPWHAATLRVDTADELFGPLSRGLEAEANYGASRLIFQAGAFAERAGRYDRSLRTAFELAAAFGASRHAAAHHYVETHGHALALLVAGRWPDATGRLPVWRSVESASFRRRFGRLEDLPLHTSSGPLAPAIEAARRSSQPVAAALSLTDRGGRARPFSVEVFNNRHCHLALAVERVAAATVRAA